MRVLVVLLSVNFAGTERHAIELANALARQTEVALLLRRRPRERHRQSAYAALLQSVDPAVRVFFASRAMPVFGLWLALARFRPDLIHAHYQRSAYIASRYAFGVPVLATVHVHFRARDYMRCGGLIFLTRAEAEGVPPAYAGARFVIGNWVVPRPSPTAEVLQSMRAALGISAADYVIGSVARLEPVKGLEGLIRAFHAAAIPRSRLVVVGQGSQRNALEQIVSQLDLGTRVIFTGFRADALDFYWLFDLFVLNSLDEPYALAILEAAAAGVPVITTATPGSCAIAERLPIRLIPIGSTADLVQALRAAYAERRSKAVPELADFSIERGVARIVAAYHQVLSRSRPRRNHAEGGATDRAEALDPVDHA